MNHHDSFGGWLKHRRKALDLTQPELGQLAGCTLSAVKKLETNTLRPSKPLVERLIIALNIQEDEQAAFRAAARARSPAPGSPPVPVAPSPSPHTGLSIPITPTALIGRDAELAAVCTLLQQTEVRLLTLTGAPGIGKTRLAREAAAAVAARFANGVVFVALAPIRDPGLVVSALAQALGVREAGRQPLLDLLLNYLREKQLLLVLDNVEHLLESTPSLTTLLRESPHLKLLVTSRVVLRLGGEHDYAVPPLALPPTHIERKNREAIRGQWGDDSPAPPATERMHAISTAAAVELFVQRARAVKPDFVLTEANAAAVAEICTRLDGLPLAIELAAARSKLLTPQALLRRLDQRLTLLTSQATESEPRHQTLRGAIGWSYELLNADEQALFRRLGVFVGQGRLLIHQQGPGHLV